MDDKLAEISVSLQLYPVSGVLAVLWTPPSPWLPSPVEAPDAATPHPSSSPDSGTVYDCMELEPRVLSTKAPWLQFHNGYF